MLYIAIERVILDEIRIVYPEAKHGDWCLYHYIGYRCDEFPANGSQQPTQWQLTVAKCVRPLRHRDNDDVIKSSRNGHPRRYGVITLILCCR